MNIKKTATLLIALLLIPTFAYALGLEAGVGYWKQTPSGTFSYNAGSATDEIDLKNDAGLDAKWSMTGRVKVDTLPLLPNVYLMASPMEFTGAGAKNVTFTFGDTTFSANAPFNSKLQMDQFDVALYYPVPMLKLATMGKLNVEIGLNARLIKFAAEVDAGNGVTDSKSLNVPLPMVYAGVQVKPIDMLSIEGEVRAVSFKGNHYYDYIGRLKVKPVPVVPLFLGGGYRAEDVLIDVSDVKAVLKVGGPFIEAGFEF